MGGTWLILRGVSKDVAKYKIIIVHGFGSSKEMNFLAPQVRELSIEFARVGGVEIPNNKRIEFSLQYIHGIGRSRDRKILCDISMDNKQRKKKNNSSMAQTLAMPIAPSLALISNSRPLSRAVYFPVLNPPKVRELSIECARVGGVEIPNNKRIEFSLQYIHGIRRSRARKILCDISMDNKVTKDLSEEDLITLRDEVSKYVIEGDLIGKFAEEGKRNISAMCCRSRTYHLLYQRQALRIFQRSLQRKKKNNSSMAQTLAMPIAPSLALISNPRPLSRAVYFPVLNPPKVRELSIECARVGGVEIPNNKKIEFSLQYIHGIGRSRARKILCDISMDNKVTKDLSEEDLITLRDEVSKYVIEGDLVRVFL
ncbi:30S ribosomal protein [Arachis hypogaea]|nr:30S ribosomal protein [Arachis hypogaea]